jgi:hypothetical protein
VSDRRLTDLLASFIHDSPKFFRNSLIFGSFSASANRAHSVARFKHSIASRFTTHLHIVTRRMAVCTENLIRIDCVTESPNVNGDDRALLPLPDPVRLAVQVEEPT